MVRVSAKRSETRRQAILRAAAGVFQEKGYLGTSMEEIATTAGVSKQTVYNHFADKEQLFFEIVLATTNEIDEIVRLVATTLDDTTDLEKDLRRLARILIAALMDPKLLQLRRLVIANADRFSELGTAWYERGFERVLSTLASSFEKLAKRKLLHFSDAKLAADHFVGMLLWIPVNRAMFTGNHAYHSGRELEKYADAAVSAFLTGHAQKRADGAHRPT
jgi:TetR/AcrR family transcriptional regulator, mexJK operon transcriptional repressor